MVGAGSCSSLGRLAERVSGSGAAEGHAASWRRGRGRLYYPSSKACRRSRPPQCAFTTEVTSTSPRTRRTLCWPPAKYSKTQGEVKYMGPTGEGGDGAGSGWGTPQSGSSGSGRVSGREAQAGLVSRWGYCACSGPCWPKGAIRPCLPPPYPCPSAVAPDPNNSDRYVLASCEAFEHCCFFCSPRGCLLLSPAFALWISSQTLPILVITNASPGLKFRIEEEVLGDRFRSPTCLLIGRTRHLYRCSAQGLTVSTVARRYWWSGP